jgi:hypothetical protein
MRNYYPSEYEQNYRTEISTKKLQQLKKIRIIIKILNIYFDTLNYLLLLNHNVDR